MKTLSAIADAQRKIYTAGAGLAFVAALFFCGTPVSSPEFRFFSPFRNEFLCLLQTVLLIAAFLFGHLFGEGRSSVLRRFLSWIFFGLVPAVFLWTFRNVSGSSAYLIRLIVICLPAGLFAGEIRQYAVRPVHYNICCLAGAAAGVMFAWLLRLRPGLIGPERVLFSALFILLWTVFRRISCWKCSRTIRVMAMILWGICIVIPAALPIRPAPDKITEPSVAPAEIAMAGLQPGKRDLSILQIGGSRHLTDDLASFPLTRKLVAVSPKDSAGLGRLHDHAPSAFDLIVLEMPVPDSLYALRMYSPGFPDRLRETLKPDGVLAVFLPEDIVQSSRTKTVSLVHGPAERVLKKTFTSVKSAGGDLPVLFCGGENVTDSPQELNRRAMELKLMPSFLPEEAFSLFPEPEEQPVREDVGPCGPELMWSVIRQHPRIERTGLGSPADELRSYLLPVLAGILILMLAIRYFCSGRTASKRNWLSLENGVYIGLAAILLLVPYQLDTGQLDPDWLSLTGIFLIAAFAGMLASIGHHHSFLLQKLLLGVSLLAPWCGLVFLHGYHQPDQLVYYALAGYIGYTSGMIAADIRSETAVTMTGFCIGLLLGGLLCWLPGGAVWAPILAVLCRIPPMMAENLQKQFEKSPGRG